MSPSLFLAISSNISRADSIALQFASVRASQICKQYRLGNPARRSATVELLRCFHYWGV